MSFKWLPRDIAAMGPYLTLVTSEAEYIKALKDCGILNPSDWCPHHARTHTLKNKQGQAVCIVAIKVMGDPIETACLLVHEAVHVWQEYCEDIGEDSPGAEQEAYAIQAISQRLMTEYARRLK